MEKVQFRKITSRILRHSGFKVKMNKATHEYELYDSSPTPTLYCKPIIMESETQEAEMENYLCFRVLEELNENHKKLYDRMINRFTRLAPSINISLENESEPIFNDEQLDKLGELLEEYENKGDNNDSENNN